MKIKAIELIEFGIAKTDSDEQELSEGSIAGYFLRGEQIEFIRRTATIPAKKNLEFGIYYIVHGFDPNVQNELVQFSCRLIHPKMVHPETLEATTELTDFKS